MTNGDPDAILIITRRMSPVADPDDRAPEAPANGGSFSVGYNPRAEKWMIVHQSGKPIALSTAFNVLVFKV